MQSRILQKLIPATAISLMLAAASWAQNMPFPQFKSYGLKPSGTNLELSNAIMAEYDLYKKFLKKDGSDYYILSTSTNGDKNTITVSEAHGFGMTIFAIMAGKDPLAKTYFDGMLSFWENYNTDYLMDWEIYDDGSTAEGPATDGDLDIAYALLLAYEQWGDAAYLTTATNILDAIWGNEINQSTNLPLIDNGGTQAQITRPSDWMAGHFRTFAEYDNGSAWGDVVSAIYNSYNNWSDAATGLVPDFYNGSEPAYDGLLPDEEKVGDYYYNACRVPLRFAMDYATSGNLTAKTATKRFAEWITTKTGGDIDKIYSGYSLNGDVLTDDNYNSLEFSGPFGASMIATTNQTFMDAIWSQLQDLDGMHDIETTAYGEALCMLSMLVMSGNWWKPGDDNTYVDVNVGISPRTMGASSAASIAGVRCEKGALTFTATSPSQASGSFALINASGREILQRSFSAQQGMHQYSFANVTIPAGVYYLKSDIDGVAATRQVVISR